MKSLQESLFDGDLVEKGVKIDFDTLQDMLFSFGRKKAKFFDKAAVIYHEGRQTIFIKKFLGNNDEICFELQFGVTNVHPDSAAFNVPMMVVHDRWEGAYVDGWKTSRTDVNATKREIDRVIKLENNDKLTSTIEATDNNISKVFNLYDGMLREFCSPQFKKELENYMDRYSEKKVIPGLILDMLMKKLITHS